MAVTEAQARRALRRADFPWSSAVEDPRKEWNQVHAHHGLLSVLAAAFACGRIHLRRVEDFSADLGVGARRQLGVGKAVSDSTFYRTLEKQKPEGFRESTWAYVRSLIEAKVVANDLFPFGVMTFDGKKVWASTTSYVDGAKTSVDENTGVMTASLMSLRAVLTSSKVRPCVDFEVIGDKEGESPAFRVVFPRACQAFGGQFEIVTVDAGMTCRENAQLVDDAGKYYVAALKGNQPTLQALAEEMFKGCPGGLKKRDVEHRDGSVIIRELHTITVKDVPAVDMPGVQQLWRVVQQTFTGEKLTSEDVRYFLSSIPPTLLTPAQQLLLVRLHWGIENGHNWTMDVALTEDDVQPCQKSREAIEVVAWLRVVGCNLLAAWRAQAGTKDKLPLSWERCMELLRDAFVFSSAGVLRATLV
jgi:hypothetical protein